MAKKKSRPSFNLPSTDESGSTPASAEWVYRSDAGARAATPAVEPAPAPPRERAMTPAATTALSRRESSVDRTQADAIVGNYATLAAGAGLIPAPALDVLAIGGLQLKMVGALADHYGVPFTRARGKAILSAVLGGVFSARLAYGVGGSLLKAIPVLGPALGAFAMPGFGAAMTYAVGAVFVQHFERGGTLGSVDAGRFTQAVDRELQRG